MSAELKSLIEAAVRNVVAEQFSLGLSSGSLRRLDVERGTTEDGRQYCWGYWDTYTNSLKPEFNSMLTGYIRRIGVRKTEYKNKKSNQLLVEVSAGPTLYRIKAGLESAAGKNLVCAIAVLSKERLARPVSISVRPGDDDKVVLVTLFQKDEMVRGLPWPGDANALRTAYKRAKQHLEVLKFDENGRVARN